MSTGIYESYTPILSVGSPHTFYDIYQQFLFISQWKKIKSGAELVRPEPRPVFHMHQDSNWKYIYHSGTVICYKEIFKVI